MVNMKMMLSILAKSTILKANIKVSEKFDQTEIAFLEVGENSSNLFSDLLKKYQFLGFAFATLEHLLRNREEFAKFRKTIEETKEKLTKLE
jgi:hypothetical protein